MNKVIIGVLIVVVGGFLVFIIKQNKDLKLTKVQLDTTKNEIQQVTAQMLEQKQRAEIGILQKEELQKTFDRERQNFQAKQELLNAEKQSMQNEITGLQNRLEFAKADILEMQTQNQLLQERVNKSEQEKNVLQQEKAALTGQIINLISENVKLKEEVSVLTQIKQELEKKLNSLSYLREAIVRVKRRMHEEKIRLSKIRDEKGLREGNRGYLVRDGRPTGEVVIQVSPVSP